MSQDSTDSSSKVTVSVRKSKDEDSKRKDRKAPRFRRDSFNITCSEAETEQAAKFFEEVRSNDATGDSRIRYHFMLQFNHVIPTTDIDTMATALYADGDHVLMYNPPFVNSLETLECRQFILYHEFLHKLLHHTRSDTDVPDNGTMRLVQEIVINAVNLSRSKSGRMPHTISVDDKGNRVVEPTGIDPRKIYHETYVAQCKEAGLSPVSYEKFVESENACYTELMRLPDPPGQNNEIVITCTHGDGDSDGDGSGSSESDEIMDEIVKNAITATITEARNGSENAKAEILKLADMADEGNERAQKMWGDYGIMQLRGKSDATRKIEWWQQWLMGALASKLVPGEKLVMPKKRSAMLLAGGMDPIPQRRGQEMETNLAIFRDTSGSMSAKTCENLDRITGLIPNCTVDWYMFDGVVKRHVLGGVVEGGGGTNFQNCVDVVEGKYPVDGEIVETEYDVVIMLTDGYAPHVAPADPDKWIWLITDGGDEWPENAVPPMATHKVDTTQAASSY